VKSELEGRIDGRRSNLETDSPSFARLLRRYRLRAGLSQEALAERAGLSTDAVGMLERGVRRMPYEHTIESLGAALELGRSDRDELSSAVGRRGLRARRNFKMRVPLPVPLTSLIGRHRDLALVHSWFAEKQPRLVTITGAGGVGKTRFALALAHDLRPLFDDDAVFVSVAAIRDPANVASAILTCLDRKDDGTPASLATLCAYVSDHRLLFVVDNLEQVIDGGAVLCELLERCPEAVVLATSREALHVRGEYEFVLEPLELQPAVDLLIERGCAVQPHLDPNRDDKALQEICRRLDCLPLAIELAAARLRRESVQTLLHQVSSPLSALIFGGRDAPPRQRTMRAAIDWSYSLLTQRERTVFCICSLFEGGGSTDAVGAVLRATGSFADNASELMTSLADKHLLRLLPAAGWETRFEMLEAIREYASEQLNSLESSKAYERAFAAYYVEITSRDAQKRAARSRWWMDLVAKEYANVRAALRWSLDNDRCLGLRIAIALPEFWERKGLYDEPREWLEALMDPLEQTIEREDPMVAWHAVNALGLSYYWTEDAKRACALHERALAMTRDWNDPGTTAKSLNNLGIALLDAGEPEQARRVLEESLELKEGRDDPWSIGSTVGNLGTALRACGDHELALKCHRRAHDLFRSIGDTWGEIGELNYIGDVYWDRREYGKAASCYASSLEANVEGIASSISHSLEGLVIVAAARHDFRNAAVLAGAIDRLWDETGRSVPRPAVEGFEQAHAAARAALGDSSFDEAWNDGTEMSLVDAIAVARRSASI
jgi:predicted ATPase/DNA-binding XRE family transcriptional regulator